MCECVYIPVFVSSRCIPPGGLSGSHGNSMFNLLRIVDGQEKHVMGGESEGNEESLETLRSERPHGCPTVTFDLGLFPGCEESAVGMEMTITYLIAGSRSPPERGSAGFQRTSEQVPLTGQAGYLCSCRSFHGHGHIHVQEETGCKIQSDNIHFHYSQHRAEPIPQQAPYSAMSAEFLHSQLTPDVLNI